MYLRLPRSAHQFSRIGSFFPGVVGGEKAEKRGQVHIIPLIGLSPGLVVLWIAAPREIQDDANEEADELFKTKKPR